MFQNRETDDPVHALFEVIGAPLSQDGWCILNVFDAKYSREHAPEPLPARDAAEFISDVLGGLGD